MIARAILAVALCGSLAAAPLRAEVSPVPTSGDPRIQTVAYDPQEVVALRVAGGFALTIVFSPDERIETVTVGDSAAWQVQVNRRADALVVKPVGFAQVTNMTVMSDQRSYNFILTTVGDSSKVNPHLVRFTYAAEFTAPEAEVAAVETVYRLKGDKDLWPEVLSDDGEFTSMIWHPDKPLPAVYHEDDTGEMALVNGTMRDGAFVIEGVYTKLIFIRGKHRATALRREAGRQP